METKWQSSHCWWFDSYNSSNSSPWLKSTLSELNEKTFSMLKLIEEDADSFAQRAEMYYKKRPELINMVEQFYRAHRSLAERYDQLKSDRAGRVRSPLRNSLSLPEGYEYVSDSATSVKSFDSFTEAAYSSEEAAESEIDDPEQDDDGAQIDQETEQPYAGGASYDELMKLRDELDQLREENEIQKNIIKQKDEEAQELVKQLSDNINELRELREEMGAVKKDNVLAVMKHEIESLKVENMFQREQVEKKANEAIEVTKKFEEAKFELMKLEQDALTKNRWFKDALVLQEKNKVEVTRKFTESKSELAKMGEETMKENRHLEDVIECEDAKDAVRHLKDALVEKNEEKQKEIEQLKNALVQKDEAIRQLKDVLAEKDEQKREAIRQLSIAMEIVREESNLLKKSLENISPRKSNADKHIFKGVNLSKLFNLSSSSQNSVIPL